MPPYHGASSSNTNANNGNYQSPIQFLPTYPGVDTGSNYLYATFTASGLVNDTPNNAWLVLNCTHTDTKGSVWTAY